MTLPPAIGAPGTLLLGATGRGAGKTELATRLIGRFAQSHPIEAAKVTAIGDDCHCPRGRPCGVCSSLEGPFAISEERDPASEKDTSRLLRSGARRVFWLRARRRHLGEGFLALARQLDPAALLVCESTSLGALIKPDLFLLLNRQDNVVFKASAARVIDRADRIVQFDGQEFDLDLTALRISGGRWNLRQRRSASALR